MNIALFGGAFNPPHIGHILIAQQVLDFTPVDEVWFVPNYDQSPPKSVAPVLHRLTMTQLLDVPKTRVSTLEIDNKLNGETITLLPYLPKEHTYHFVIGSDQLATFHTWGEYEKLVQKMPFFVFPRYGYPNEPLYDHMTVINSPLLIATNISSTKIRDRIKNKLSTTHFVPKSIEEYINTHLLYQ
jgi:nicotinate-nucleotide adenylyltransferase